MNSTCLHFQELRGEQKLVATTTNSASNEPDMDEREANLSRLRSLNESQVSMTINVHVCMLLHGEELSTAKRFIMQCRPISEGPLSEYHTRYTL